MRAASPPCQIWLLHEKASLDPSSVPHTAAGHQPIGSGRPGLGRARIWPMAVHVIEDLLAERECSLALLQSPGPRQVSRQRRAIRFRANLYSATPASARPPPPEPPLLRARSLQ